MDVDGWLDTFAAHVRARDLAVARPMFDPACFSFGTRAELADGLDALVEQQWTPTWAGTSGFRFVEARVLVDGDPTVVAARWTSTADLDGRVRTGRATLVLRADPAAPHGCRCVHTHFSATPVPERL